MNSFGRIFRVHIFGESHGNCVGVLIDGCPAGLPLDGEEFAVDLRRRQGGSLKGTTPRKEADTPMFQTGVFNGVTTGAPLQIVFANQNVKSSDYDAIKNTPRPGHADLVAGQKFGGFQDYRGGGHFSGRLTTGIVAAGVIGKKLLSGIRIEAQLVEAGGSADIESAVEAALSEGDSVGGLVECRVEGLPAGLGEPFFDSVESLISHAVFAIPAIKGIEFGAGFSCARARGSEFNDDIVDSIGKTFTNNAGGINGGLTNGNTLIFRVAVKPTASIAKTKRTVDLSTGSPTEISISGRHDACIALRVPVVVEAITAIVLTDLMMLEQEIQRKWR